MQRIHAGLLALGTLCAAAASAPALAQAPAPAPAPADEPKIADYAIDTRVRVFSDRRIGGVSETFRRPGAEFHAEAAHSSGAVGLVELATVSKASYPHGTGNVDGTGYTVVLGGGYRWGDPEGWHFGAGAAHEAFPSAKFTDFPVTLDEALSGAGSRDTKFDTSYLLFEFAYGAIEARYLHTVSKDFRGANTSTVCSGLLQESLITGDQTPGVECFLRGDKNSRGTQLLDVDYKLPLDGRTTLLLHGGLKKVKNFSEADIVDWKVGVQHKRWGIDWILEAVGTDAERRELYKASNSSGETKQLDNTAVLLTLSYTF
jgi:hypothetical protein